MLKKIIKNKFKLILNGIFLNYLWLTEYRLKNHIKSIIKFASIVDNEKWLDVGCGLRPYEVYFPINCYVGVDVEKSGRSLDMKVPDYFYDGNSLPFSDRSFDGVICTQVLEHVHNPLSLLKEMNRVVKMGGGLIISIPFIWQEHEEPYDFTRFTSFGITELLRNNGFKIECIVKDTGAIEVIAVIINSFIISNLIPHIRGLGRIVAFIICFPIQLIALILQKIIPDNGKLYLNLVVYAKKIDQH